MAWTAREIELLEHHWPRTRSPAKLVILLKKKWATIYAYATANLRLHIRTGHVPGKAPCRCDLCIASRSGEASGGLRPAGHFNSQ